MAMQEINELILEQAGVIVILLSIGFLWLLIWNFIQGSKLRKMRKRYNMMMSGTGIEDLESLLIDLKMQQGKIEDQQEEQFKQLEFISQWMPKQKTKIGIKRFNAFAETGSDLSFSVAFINEEKDGVVLTGIYNRDGSYIYAKPLDKGNSPHALSTEEKEAISLAERGA